jgi:hypothetical protein
MNLHALVRGPIQQVNRDSPGTIYVSTGHTMVWGISTPTFQSIEAQLQVQSASHESLYYLNGLTESKALSIVYAYGNFSTINRPAGTGGDLVFVHGKWWAIQNVLEGWDDVSNPEWCSFSITQQLNAATLEGLLKQIQNGAVPPPVGGP